tara:strand:- start:868 stop:1029 length:162 start_codon:yes stop_codon:yes gene_type:complete
VSEDDQVEDEVEHTHIIVDHDDDFVFKVQTKSETIDWGDVLEILIREKGKEKP